MPPEWATLPFLRALDVSSNVLQGTLPPPWFSFPQLVQLNVANNYLRGPLQVASGSLLQTNGTLTLWPQVGNNSFCWDAPNLTVLTLEGGPASAFIRQPCPGAPPFPGPSCTTL